MSNLERRQTRGVVELRAADNAERRIGGYAAKFNRLSQNLGGFVEQIHPGFFDASRDKGWVGMMARYNHDDLLASTAGGSLRLKIDETGLDYEADLLTDSVSERVLQLVTRGDVSQSSFAFYTLEDDWTLTEHGFPLRTLIRGESVDVAPVDQPAYMDTSTGLRSLAENRNIDLAHIEELARSNDLASLIKTPPVVIDLGASGTTERGETCGSAVRLEQMRLSLQTKKDAV